MERNYYTEQLYQETTSHLHVLEAFLTLQRDYKNQRMPAVPEVDKRPPI